MIVLKVQKRQMIIIIKSSNKKKLLNKKHQKLNLKEAKNISEFLKLIIMIFKMFTMPKNQLLN